MGYPSGSLTLTSGVGTSSSGDSYPTHYDYLGLGGLRAVADTTARNAITSDRRVFGMVVTLQSDGSKYILANIAMGGTDNDKTNNANWISLFTDTGITSLNTLTATTQTFATGTSGTDFAISSVSSTHTFNLPVASASNTGKLSSSDWSTFNGKQNALTFGNLTDAGTDGISITGGTGAVIGAGVSISQQVADSTHNGYLSSTDWNTFNGKQNTITKGNLTETVSNVLTITGGTDAVIGTGTTIQMAQSSGSSDGYLSSADWTTFNNKGTGDALTSNPLSQFASTTSAQLAGVISDETGYTTGAVLVFNANPTLNGITVGDGNDIALGTATGSKIGKTTNSKLSFWGATPVIQPTTGITGATLTSGTGIVLTDTDTYDGYTIAQVVAALRQSGILA